jgi:KipI family sensor histidine kinase inhibitor
LRILPYGERGLLVELPDLDGVLSLADDLRDRPPYGVVDLVPAARTVLVVLDPALRSVDDLADEIIRRAAAAPPRPAHRPTSPPVELPVRYDGEDLEAAARLAGMAPRELVDRHLNGSYVVAFCGFSPGFAYLAGGDPRLQVPRRATPRVRVPAGSVGLAGEFSGVYPSESPGGWQLIGHTEAVLWSLDRDPPALLVPGTPVRFVEVLP